MAFHLKPKEEKFFALLDQHATLSYEAADLMVHLAASLPTKQQRRYNKRITSGRIR